MEPPRAQQLTGYDDSGAVVGAMAEESTLDGETSPYSPFENPGTPRSRMVARVQRVIRLPYVAAPGLIVLAAAPLIAGVWLTSGKSASSDRHQPPGATSGVNAGPLSEDEATLEEMAKTDPNGALSSQSGSAASQSGSRPPSASASGTRSRSASAGAANGGQQGGAGQGGAGQGGTGGQDAAGQQATVVRITGLDGKCIGAAGGNSANGTAIDLYRCVGDASQQWTLPGDGTIRTLYMCMGVASNGTADGTKVQLSGCNGSSSQRWALSSNGNLVHAQSGKCLDLKDRSSADFTITQIWSCTGNSNQKWSMG